MTETQTRSDLTITATYHWTPGASAYCKYAFDGVDVGFASDAVMTLVDHWGMAFQVAHSVVYDLWDEAAREDGNDTAEVVLSENAPCEHEDLRHGGYNDPTTCEYCGVEIEFDGDGYDALGSAVEGGIATRRPVRA